MSYYFSKTINLNFNDTIDKVTGYLKAEGFGVLTEIDVKQTLKKKLDVDFKNYRILGACNPSFAYKALQNEEKIGVMLPCNVVVIEQGEGLTEVTAVDPVASMAEVQNESLQPVASEIQSRLKRIIDKL